MILLSESALKETHQGLIKLLNKCIAALFSKTEENLHPSENLNGPAGLYTLEMITCNVNRRCIYTFLPEINFEGGIFIFDLYISVRYTDEEAEDHEAELTFEQSAFIFQCMKDNEIFTDFVEKEVSRYARRLKEFSFKTMKEVRQRRFYAERLMNRIRAAKI